MSWEIVVEKTFNLGVPSVILLGHMFLLYKYAPDLITSINTCRDAFNQLIEKETVSLDKIKENFLLQRDHHTEHSRRLEALEKKSLEIVSSIESINTSLFQKCYLCKKINDDA